jgi:hypothetical protein
MFDVEYPDDESKIFLSLHNTVAAVELLQKVEEGVYARVDDGSQNEDHFPHIDKPLSEDEEGLDQPDCVENEAPPPANIEDSVDPPEEAGPPVDPSLYENNPDIAPLPGFKKCASPDLFKWGILSGVDAADLVDKTYEEVTKFGANFFAVPSGAAGKDFVTTKARELNQWVNGGPAESIVMKRDSIMEHLLLQKPHAKSKAKEHTRVLRARLVLWKNGEINTLLEDAIAIQERLNSTRPPMTPENLARKFAEYAFTGNVRAAVRMLDQAADGGLAGLTPSVIETLKSLHPEPIPRIDR